MTCKKTGSGGFTLLELTIVILIIGIAFGAAASYFRQIIIKERA